VTHLEILWSIPEYRQAVERRAERFTAVRMDKRGNGLSDRNVADHSLPARVADLEAVADDLKLKRFALLGYSEGGPTSIAYAVKHPRRVSRMVLDGTWARGSGMLGTQELRDATIALVRAEWGIGSSMLTELFLGGDAPPAFRHAFAAIQQQGSSKEDAANSMLANFDIDIRDLLPKVRAPTLVVHARGDRIVPLELGREIAGGIAGARFVSREGAHVPTSEAEAAELSAIVDAFLEEDLRGGAPAKEAASRGTAGAGGAALQTLLFTDMESSTAVTQRLGDSHAQELIRTHNAIVRQALKTHGGREIKHTGDGIMAAFGSATGAIECACAIQRAVSARTELPRVRIGLNAGEPVAEENDLFGTAVQLAKRICDAAEPAEILASNVVRELCAGKGYLFAERGIAPLKGFDEPVRLFELRWSAD
jgi:class 3 adenylate cyclase